MAKRASVSGDYKSSKYFTPAIGQKIRNKKLRAWISMIYT